MMSIRLAFGASCALLASAGAWGAESISVLGQQIQFSNPPGYCTLGTSAREMELLAVSQRGVGAGARIVHVAVLCPELDTFRRGKRDEIDHWLQIQILGAKGEFKRVEVPREAFLNGLSRSSLKLDSAEVQRRFRDAYADVDLNLSGVQVKPLGRDGNAFYLTMRMQLSSAGNTRTITGLAGVSLINSLPLSSIVYEASGSAASRDRLQPTLQALLNDLLTQN